jgi:hypothetical protein
MKYRVDIRRTKRGRIIESFWTDSFDANTRKGYFIELYQYFGKRLFKVNSFKP